MDDWTYDAWGNRTDQTATSGTCDTFHQLVDSNNHFTASPYQYDAAGNMTHDASHSYTYDAENRITKVDGGSTATYGYDVDGRRVSRVVGGVETDYMYDLSGHVVADYGGGCGATCWRVGYIYLNGQMVAEYFGGTYFVHTDHLGSTRLLTGYPTATVVECDDYYPFGESNTCGATGTTTHLFTGKERDSESNLDNFSARYDSSSMGRFMSPDPLGGHQEDPQTLNRYSYVRNNPLTLTDPTGLDFYLACAAKNHEGCTQVQIDPNNKNKTWVQADNEGNATIITSNSIRAGQNKATVDENGVQINGSNQGIYFDNKASHTTDANGQDENHNPITLAGSNALKDFSITINGNCSGTCLTSGTWSYPGTNQQAGDLLSSRGSFSILGENARASLGFGDHPHSTQYRFGGPNCSTLFSCANSPHLSVPNDPNYNVPRGFHVDAHGDPYHHNQDVNRNGVE